MASEISGKAGSAVRWRVAQLAGVNLFFLIRILVLARILSPDSFGLFALAMVPVGLLLQASEFGMIPALVQNQAPRRTHYDTAWSIGMLRGLLISSFVFLTAPLLAAFTAEPRVLEVTRVLALQPLLLAGASIGIADLQRRLDFRPLAIIHLCEAIANTAVAIVLAPTLGVWALVAGMLAGSLTRMATSYAFAPHWPRLSIHRVEASSLIRFGRWVFVTSMVTVAAGAIVRLIITRQLGAADLGLYYLATRLTFMLGGTVTGVGTSVAFPMYARLSEDPDAAARIFRLIWTGISALLIPALAILIALAPQLVSYLLGAQWDGTAPIIRALAFVVMLALFSDLCAPLWQGFGQPWRYALIESAQAAVLVTGVWLLSKPMGVLGAAIAWIPAVLLSLAISAIFLARILPNALATTAEPISSVFVASLVAALTAHWVANAMPGATGTILAILLGTMLAAGLLWFADRRFQLGLYEAIIRLLPFGKRVKAS